MTMKCCCGLKIFFILMLFTQLANAKSPCNKLATTAFFNSSLAPIVSTPDSLKDANAEMADGETFCKRLVQAVKTKKTTSGILRKKADDMLKAAKDDFEHDGDMDKLELAKYQYDLVVGSARIAE
ncbi:TPA: hypothetical protein H2W97_004007 [Salmonella enterica]|uniref:hypothetical protein n=1 Tax=Enterobacter roggenkampii TaxID=1812935 RepID=UPI0019C39B17|nr:hypothetical protein [Salmonella enterica subsp. enterica serovar Orion]HAK7474940.1 hypothetical protein [Salmonella enterica]HAK8236116.1 hypothetical protein [Salmonella enterica]HAK8549881.1 hypothetical protein [Salmonella enterica]HAK8582243.1 hypothetical protein [Salmonella enterica]